MESNNPSMKHTDNIIVDEIILFVNFIRISPNDDNIELNKEKLSEIFRYAEDIADKSPYARLFITQQSILITPYLINKPAIPTLSHLKGMYNLTEAYLNSPSSFYTDQLRYHIWSDSTLPCTPQRPYDCYNYSLLFQGRDEYPPIPRSMINAQLYNNITYQNDPDSVFELFIDMLSVNPTEAFDYLHRCADDPKVNVMYREMWMYVFDESPDHESSMTDLHEYLNSLLATLDPEMVSLAPFSVSLANIIATITQNDGQFRETVERALETLKINDILQDQKLRDRFRDTTPLLKELDERAPEMERGASKGDARAVLRMADFLLRWSANQTEDESIFFRQESAFSITAGLLLNVLRTFPEVQDTISSLSAKMSYFYSTYASNTNIRTLVSTTSFPSTLLSTNSWPSEENVSTVLSRLFSTLLPAFTKPPTIASQDACLSLLRLSFLSLCGFSEAGEDVGQMCVHVTGMTEPCVGNRSAFHFFLDATEQASPIGPHYIARFFENHSTKQAKNGNKTLSATLADEAALLFLDIIDPDHQLFTNYSSHQSPFLSHSFNVASPTFYPQFLVPPRKHFLSFAHTYDYTSRIRKTLKQDPAIVKKKAYVDLLSLLVQNTTNSSITVLGYLARTKLYPLKQRVHTINCLSRIIANESTDCMKSLETKVDSTFRRILTINRYDDRSDMSVLITTSLIKSGLNIRVLANIIYLPFS
ncbi:hypothetical protein BLNAU_13027 [Blattamonas nauphoetae]|uniref:Uncharacterized protein n=1 Tax=Blattamonas nauphoetae TaxID=2049346 RepID=A0ABQ9XPJ2_9EUKA|nr:hypothetical protein BLNAU_13027 [Blattamonas nauphoetae]